MALLEPTYRSTAWNFEPLSEQFGPAKGAGTQIDREPDFAAIMMTWASSPLVAMDWAKALMFSFTFVISPAMLLD